MTIEKSKMQIVATLKSIIPIVGKMGVKIERFDPGSMKVHLLPVPSSLWRTTQGAFCSVHVST
ncbi:MAG: hypothetical protein AB2L22_01615 [Syntrophales bacterium]